MKKDLLRLIYQRRFKLMNRWNAGAMAYQPKFGGVSDIAFRSFIFNAFEKLTQALRQEEKEGEAPGTSLLEQFDFPKAPDLIAYREILEAGIAVLDAFIAEDPACTDRFSKAVREEVRRSLKEAGASFMEVEARAYKKQFLSDRPGSVTCIHCGRPLAE
ncbi:MAG: hypothetical protein WD490_09995 [Opitutales bacterium]